MAEVNPRMPVLATVITILFIALASWITLGWTEPPEGSHEPEVSPAAAALLNLLNTAPEAKLRHTPGLQPDVVTKLLAYRAGGGKLKNLVEFTRITNIQPTDTEILLKPFQDQEMARQMEAERKAVPDPAARAKGGRMQKSGGADPNSAAANSGPIGAVRPGFYMKLPGYDDLDKIDPLKRTEFLETINRESCSCGCQGETIAYCLVNDPGCPVVKARAKKIYDDIMSKAPR